MAQETLRIPLSTLSRALPDSLVPDGGMADLYGLRLEDGALRPIPPDKQTFTLGLGALPAEATAFYVHQAGSGRKNVFVLSGGAVYYYSVGEGEGTAAEGPFLLFEGGAGEITSFSTNGNMVEFISGTDSRFYYWDKTSASYLPYTRLPEGITVRISRDTGDEYLNDNLAGTLDENNIHLFCYNPIVEAFGREYSFLKERDEMPSGFNLPDNIYDPALSGHLTNMSSEGCVVPEELVGEIKQVREGWLGKCIAEKSDSRLVLTGLRLAVCVVRGLNGNVQAVSPIALFDAGAAPSVFSFGAAEIEKNANLGHFWKSSGPCYVHACMAPVAAGRYKAVVDFPDWESHKDQVTGVDIYLSRPLDADADGQITRDNAPLYGTFQQCRREGSNVRFWSSTCIMQIPLKSMEELQEAVDNTIFYRSASFSTGEISEGKSKDLAEVSEADEALDLSFVLPAAGSDHSISFVFNGRFHLAGVEDSEAETQEKLAADVSSTPTVPRTWEEYTYDQDEFVEPDYADAAKVYAQVPEACTKYKSKLQLFSTYWGINELLGTARNGRAMDLKTVVHTAEGDLYKGMRHIAPGEYSSPVCSHYGDAESFTLYCRVEIDGKMYYFKRTESAHQGEILPWSYALNRLDIGMLSLFSTEDGTFALRSTQHIREEALFRYHYLDPGYYYTRPPFEAVELNVQHYAAVAPFHPIVQIPTMYDYDNALSPCLAASPAQEGARIHSAECFDTRWEETTEEDFDTAGMSHEYKPYSGNTLLVSAQYDPFSVAAADVYTVGKGRILALSAGTGDVSAGTKYGAYPLYVFCTDGIYMLGLSQAADGPVYSEVALVSSLSLADPASVTPCRTGVAFRTLKGIMYISGQQVTELSIPLEGDPGLPSAVEQALAGLIGREEGRLPAIAPVADGGEDFLTLAARPGTAYAWDPTADELLVRPDGKPFAYAFQFASSSWVKRPLEGKAFVQDFPSLYRVGEEEEGRGAAFYDLTQEAPSAGKPCEAYFLTRPLKAGSTAFKRLSRLALDGLVTQEGEAASALLLFGSNDRTHWKLLGGNLRRAPSRPEYEAIAVPAAARPWKYYRAAFLGKITGCSLTHLSLLLAGGDKPRVAP